MNEQEEERTENQQQEGEKTFQERHEILSLSRIVLGAPRINIK
jgi:hypothetical protein